MTNMIQVGSAPKLEHVATSRMKWSSALVVALLILGLVLIGSDTPRYFSVANMKAIITSASLVGITALGLTLITIGGSAVSLAISQTVATLAMTFLATQSLGLIPSLVVTIAVGAIITGLQGAVVGYGAANPIVLSIAASFAIAGLATGISGGLSVSPSALGYQKLNAAPGGIALSVYFLIAIALLLETVLRRTAFGRSLYMVGGNRNAAVAAGLRVGRTTTIAWSSAGALFAVTAAFSGAFNQSANISLSGTLTFDAVAAVLAGGTPIAGGRGSAMRTLMGALLISAISDLLLLRGYSTGAQITVKGLLVLVIVIAVHVRATRGER